MIQPFSRLAFARIASESLENLRTTQDRLVQTEKLASLGQLTDCERRSAAFILTTRGVLRSTRSRTCCRAISTQPMALT
jgi:hypothetical protein